jgi:hypothetical protein
VSLGSLNRSQPCSSAVLSADLVCVDDEAVRAEALGHAEQLLAVVAHRPFVGRPEVREHLNEIGLELIARQRLDQLCWPHHFARPRIVDVDQVPDIGLAGAQPISLPFCSFKGNAEVKESKRPATLGGALKRASGLLRTFGNHVEYFYLKSIF